jgi:hypothetical protein
VTPEASYRLISEFNWDDDLAPVAAIVDSASTDFATALMIFWRLDGPWMKDDDADCNATARELNLRVRSNLVSGFYTNRRLHYDPVADNGLSKVQVYKLLKNGVEPVLLEPV